MYVLSKIIGTMGQPPALVLIVLLLLIKSLKPFYRSLLIPFIFLLYLLSISIGANFLLTPLETWEPHAAADSAELIVIPGAGSTGGRSDGRLISRLSAESRSRLLEGVVLYRELGLPVLFCGGGLGEGRSNEADAAMAMLLKSGIPADKIILEDTSLSTRENALNAAELTDIRNIILVSSAFHIRRASDTFIDAGFMLYRSVKVAPRSEQGALHFTDFLPSMKALANSSLALHEYGGLLFYGLLQRF